MEKKLKHPKKVKTIEELRMFILYEMGCDWCRRFFEIFHFGEDELMKIWNEPVKEESWFNPETVEKKGTEVVEVELVKRFIANIYFLKRLY